ncbi:MAG: DsrE family protein [Gammaproteobacteria bacterium]|jgi:intracellular sulfur oxidation DsrE/DsrF family protein
MNPRQTTLKLCALLFCWLLSSTAHAAMLKDTEALQGLKQAKAVFMIDVNNPGRVAHVLRVIGKTDKGLREQGVKPHIIVVIIGPAVAFLTRDRRGISYMDERAVSQVQGEIHKFATMGIRTEACGVAMKGMDVAPKDLIPDVHAVGNGFISAIGYQAHGYELVPVY